MRNKGLNNNLTDTISKGGVLYRPGEIPVLTKEQLAQANLVSKLPHDFPFANWEGMTTKQQLQQMKYSGLNPQEQWSLLNANVPLGVLKEHNQAQEYAAAQATPVQAPALLSAKAVQSLAQNIQNASTNSSISPSLQSAVPQRKLDVQKANQQTNLLGKSIIAPTNPIKITNPTKAPYRNKPVENGDGSDDTGGEDGKNGNFFDWLRSLLSGNNAPKEKPKATPQIVPITTPQIVPITMDTPKPAIPMTPTPSPTLSPSEQRAQAAVQQAMAYADKKVKYQMGGTNPEEGFDCCNLIEAVTKNTNLKYGQGNLSKSAKDLVKSFYDHPEFGKPVYNYTEDSQIPPLQAGDLVFSADADKLTENKHVTMATGNGLQVVEASGMANVMKVTYQFDAYKTHKDDKYYRDSGQIITYVIRPFY